MPRPVVMRRGRAAPEKRLQHQIRRALETLGFDVTSTSQPQRAMMTAGIPDLYARHQRWRIRLWIEVKTPKGRIRPAQAAWIEAERAAGGHAIVARSVGDVLDALRDLGAPIETPTGRREMSDATTQPPADVRGRIIRASILPIEDEETLIAGLRAGAEAVERGELDAEDFAGIWSQYLRELFRRASSVPAPADVRERVDVPGLPDGITPLTGVFTTHHAGRPHAIVLWQGAPWLVWQHPDGHWVTEAKVQVAALRSEAQGEVWREVDDLLARLERFEYDAAGESEEYWRVVAMRDRIAAARLTDRSESDGA